MAHVLYIDRIEEHVVEGRRLGRHAAFDSRSLAYQVPPADVPIVTRLWTRNIPILDQGQIGSCEGNAQDGALGTSPLFEALPAGHPALDEAEAVRLYTEATRIDPFPGSYPGQDTGTDTLSACKAAKADGLTSGYLAALALAQMQAALMTGPVVVGWNWYDCIPAGQRVLTSDLRWVPIEKVQVGDELIGFDEQLGRAARYRRSGVTALGTKHAPVYEITTDQGTVYSSGGHLFVRSSSLTAGGGLSKGRQEWVRADTIRPGDRLAYFMPPYDEDTSWEAGWLSGFFDGEGTVNGPSHQLNFGQALGPTLDRAVRLLAAKGYETSVKQHRPAGTDGRGIVSRKDLANIYVAGGYHGALRFLGEVRPARLLNQASQLWEGKATRSRCCPPAIVQDARMVGAEIVHTIGTTTQTLVVEGFLSHNSMDNPDSSGLITISPGASVRGGHALVIRGIDMEAALFRGDNSWSADWGDGGSFSISFADVEREFAEQGDCYQPLPAGVAPPVPVPPGPTPPGPVNPADAAYAADPRIVRWAHDPHLMHDNKYAAQQFLRWKKQLGL